MRVRLGGTASFASMAIPWVTLVVVGIRDRAGPVLTLRADGLTIDRREGGYVHVALAPDETVLGLARLA